eukprot:GHRQ01027600.1.p3 GENE.GHRQ01027600.1~~GHRQ01027600.1.p3  ORF type:complete len:106 (+),score=27.66 GHRQ01027600.1:392-709(+)
MQPRVAAFLLLLLLFFLAFFATPQQQGYMCLLLQLKHVSLGLGGGRDNKRTVREAIRKFTEDTEVRYLVMTGKFSVNFLGIREFTVAPWWRLVSTLWSAATHPEG